MSEREHLLTIEDTFLISGRGLVLAPALPVPSNGRFSEFEETVVVRRPDGGTRECRARFGLAHFRLVGGGSRWDIVVLLPDMNRDEVPVGSEVLASNSAIAAIRNVVP